MNAIPFIMLILLILIIYLIRQEFKVSGKVEKYVIRDGRYIAQPDENITGPEAQTASWDDSAQITQDTPDYTGYIVSQQEDIQRAATGNWYEHWRENGFSHEEISREFPYLDLSESKRLYENDPDAGY